MPYFLLIHGKLGLSTSSVACQKTAGPGPLKIESADPSVGVENFAREKKPRLKPGFHRLFPDFPQVHPAGGDFRFGIAGHSRDRQKVMKKISDTFFPRHAAPLIQDR